MTPPKPIAESGHVPIPRGLVFVASGWIAFSWLVVIGLRPPLQPTSSAYTPAAEMMVMCIAIGCFIAWPLVRLTVAPRPAVRMRTALEIVALVALIQIVIWPLRLVTSWSVPRVLWLDLEMISTLALLGGLTILSMHRAGFRTVSMAIIVAWMIVPALVEFGLGGDILGTASPLIRVWNLTQGGAAPIPLNAWAGPLVTTVLAVGIWVSIVRHGLAGPLDSQ